MSENSRSASGQDKHPRPSIWRRLRLLSIIWSLKIPAGLYCFLKRRFFSRGRLGPTYTKRYAALPQSLCRIFIPPTWKAGDKPLPLIIDIHGGGFTIGDPVLDDPANCSFAYKHGFAVVAIGYRLAPATQFPGPPTDCAALIKAVLDDAELPIDRSRVAVQGYSAGGNLTLASVQLDGLHDRVQACISYYGVTDFVQTVDEKLLTRVSDGKTDMLKRSSPAFNYAYVPYGTDRRNPLLSPRFAPRNTLPKHIYLLGCEHDLLCNESRLMADELAEHETGQRVMYSNGTGWRKGNLRWELIKGQVHGFNQILGTGAAAAMRADRAEKMYADVANWLKQEVFK